MSGHRTDIIALPQLQEVQRVHAIVLVRTRDRGDGAVRADKPVHAVAHPIHARAVPGAVVEAREVVHGLKVVGCGLAFRGRRRQIHHGAVIAAKPFLALAQPLLGARAVATAVVCAVRNLTASKFAARPVLIARARKRVATWLAHAVPVAHIAVTCWARRYVARRATPAVITFAMW